MAVITPYIRLALIRTFNDQTLGSLHLRSNYFHIPDMRLKNPNEILMLYKDIKDSQVMLCGRCMPAYP